VPRSWKDSQRSRRAIATILDEEPALPSLRATERFRVRIQCEAAAQLNAAECYPDLAQGKLFVRWDAVLRVVRARAPDDYRPNTVLADGYHALEFGIFEWMILGTYGRTFFDRIHRGFGHRPGYKHSMDRESEAIMQASSIAFWTTKMRLRLLFAAPDPPVPMWRVDEAHRLWRTEPRRERRCPGRRAMYKSRL
jgi:hypothetical protein